jgi:hypothetical protein
VAVFDWPITVYTFPNLSLDIPPAHCEPLFELQVLAHCQDWEINMPGMNERKSKSFFMNRGSEVRIGKQKLYLSKR